MKKTLLICITILLSFSLSQAQTDTTKYDLGRLQIDKKLTQAITIKAADLEKMPFANLSDAINTWFYGIYGSQQSFVPVIDGIVMTDVNALSIYDIDEITLVQNAAASLNGAAPQQFLLLIKTRRKRPGKSGIEAAGQTNIVTLNKTPISANSNYKVKNTYQFYNQYYLSGYINTTNVHAGVSADYQRDAMPASKSQLISNNQVYSTDYASVVNRYKLNGYLDANLGKSTILSISTGYVPQPGDGSSTSVTGYSATSLTGKIKDNLYYSNVSLKSSLAGFQNTLTGGYEHYKNAATTATVYYQGTISTDTSLNVANSYLIKDNLSYTFKAGGWEVAPNINLMYRRYKDTTYQSQITKSGSGPGSSYQSSVTTTSGAQKSTLLTPALNISYRRIFELQGGFETILSHPDGGSNNYKPKKAYPFASVMLNIMDKENGATGLSIFGSYANIYSYTTDIYNLLSDANYVNPFPAIYSFGNIVYDDPFKAFNQWQTGATLNLLSNKLIFNYTLRSLSLNTAATYIMYDPYYSSYYYYHYTLASKLITHRFGLDINWVKSNKISLQTNLNASYIKITSAYPANFPILPLLAGKTAKSHLVTGGFVNRLNYKRAFLGADVLYVFEGANTGVSVTKSYHAFNLQNLYAGFKVNINGINNMEVFANARSIAEDSSPALLDTRKYYGLGFKLGIQ